MTDEYDADALADEQLRPGEVGWIRDDSGQLVYVYVKEDGSYLPIVPPTLTPPEPGKPIFPSEDDDELGTLRWFGESWGAPICDPRAHVAIPVGLTCIGHEHMHDHRSDKIEQWDRGVTMPYLNAEGGVETVAFHLDCWLHEVGADRL